MKPWFWCSKERAKSRVPFSALRWRRSRRWRQPSKRIDPKTSAEAFVIVQLYAD
jgi:hypothetical protein